MRTPPRPRSKRLLGRTLYWCSHFAAYILPARCAGGRAMGRRTPEELRAATRRAAMRIARRVRAGGSRGMSVDLAQDYAAACAARAECIRCPGVAIRSARERRKGELA